VAHITKPNNVSAHASKAARMTSSAVRCPSINEVGARLD